MVINHRVHSSAVSELALASLTPIQNSQREGVTAAECNFNLTSISFTSPDVRIGLGFSMATQDGASVGAELYPLST